MADSDSKAEITCREAAVKKWADIKNSMEALSLLAEDDLSEANILIGQMKLVYSLKQTFP